MVRRWRAVFGHDLSRRRDDEHLLTPRWVGGDNADETGRNLVVMRKLRPIRQIDSASAHAVTETDTHAHVA